MPHRQVPRLPLTLAPASIAAEAVSAVEVTAGLHLLHPAVLPEASPTPPHLQLLAAPASPTTAGACSSLPDGLGSWSETPMLGKALYMLRAETVSCAPVGGAGH